MPKTIPAAPLWTWLGGIDTPATEILVRWISNDGASHLSTLSVETDEVTELHHETGEPLDHDTLVEVTHDVHLSLTYRDTKLSTDGSLRLERALMADFAALTIGAV